MADSGAMVRARAWLVTGAPARVAAFAMDLGAALARAAAERARRRAGGGCGSR